MKEARVGIRFAFTEYVGRVPSPDGMDWPGMFAGRRSAVGVWRRADTDANGTADGNSRAYANGHQHPYADARPSNVHARAHAVARANDSAGALSWDHNAGAGQRSRCT